MIVLQVRTILLVAIATMTMRLRAQMRLIAQMRLTQLKEIILWQEMILRKDQMKQTQVAATIQPRQTQTVLTARITCNKVHR